MRQSDEHVLTQTLPLAEAVLLPAAVKGDDPVTFHPDILAHRPRHGVTGSGPQERHAVPQLDPETGAGQRRDVKSERLHPSDPG